MAKNSASGHHHATLSGCIFAIKALIDNRKKTVKQQYVPHMSLEYGKLRPPNRGIGLPVWGIPAHFNGFRVLAAFLHGTLVAGVNQTLRR